MPASSHPAVIEHLKKLGVTAIELMPVHQFVNDGTLEEKGLNNYWGYNTIGFFAPQNTYSSSGDVGHQVQEFKAMVRELHKAGIEVILDVVYNHTAEGNHLGPTLSFKGIDNQAYYRLVDDDLKHYMDYTGTGNSLNVRHPHSLQLLMDSLRYWVTEMHVDGFRFDLASTLAREFYDVDKLSTFFELIQQDPIVSQVKLIAEPWDIGPGGYQVGNFPPQWTEWNGKYRDTVRDFWRGEPSTLGEFASRLTGSADLYESSARRPVASINFVTAHDGFTMRDLVSYNEKHNDANGEGNNDGESHNRSWNCGEEGDTDDDQVLTLRARQQRNFIATLLLSQGVPMLLHGDELGRTQQGNNNTYCQDSELSWIHWDAMDQPLVEFTAVVNKIRHDHPIFRRSRFFDGRPVRPRRGREAAGHRLAEDGRHRNAAGGLGQRLRPDHRCVLQRPRHPGTGLPRPPDHRRQLPARLQRPRRRRGLRPAGRGVLTVLGRAGGHRGPGRHRGAAQGRFRAETGRQVHGGAPGHSGPEVEVDYSAAASLASMAEHEDALEEMAEAQDKAAEAARRRRQMRTPVSTYRLQIRPGFTLQDAAETVPYLKSLGVDWIYLSPILTAEKGSDHGYDVTDPSAIDPDRGGPEGLTAASQAAREAGMGVLVDIVPNHVGVATPAQNPWWWSLLKEGQQSRYAPAFDVDWDFGGGRIRIPVLGSDSDVDALEIKDGELRYYDHRFPLAEGSYTEGATTPARSTTGSTTS